MRKKKRGIIDYTAGLLIIACFLFFYFIGFLGLGSGINTMPISASLWKLPLDLFMLPQIFILKLFKFNYGFIPLLICALIPGLIYAFSVKLAKKKMRRRRQVRTRKSVVK